MFSWAESVWARRECLAWLLLYRSKATRGRTVIRIRDVIFRPMEWKADLT